MHNRHVPTQPPKPPVAPKKKKKSRYKPKYPPGEGRKIGLANLRPVTKGQILNPTGKNGVEWRTRIKREVQAYLAADKEPDLMDLMAEKKRPKMVPRYINTLASIHRSALQGNFPQQQWEMGMLGASEVTTVRSEITGPDGEPLGEGGAPRVMLYLPSGANTREDPPPATPPADPEESETAEPEDE